MGTTIRTFTATVMLAAAIMLPGPAPASAAADVHRGDCGPYRLSDDRVCLMAARGTQRNSWRVTVDLHIHHQRGHDWVFAAGLVGTGGHVWLGRRHAGRTRMLGRITAEGEAIVSQGQYHSMYDGPGRRARACGDAKGGQLRVCTAWH
ncbi:hypothetical protein GT030_30200 [Streptomyces sp. SID1328]|uniref:hypothetical protein n=1 Tax=Streptomyces sp. SID1328 TaxID=2690250 RepID=UPI00136E6610|nr:hypothetical protein [Streptomyces sp. SID1328]MYV43019.1 hypothetical protein [Streptomyces sp. SID1328]